MFARPGLCGMGIGRLGLVAASRPSLVAQALAILAKYGSAANLYLPGVGAINGITAGNWLDTVGGTPATVDGAVGAVVNARGGANLTQSTAANRPVLRRGLVNQLLWSDFQNGVTDAPIRGGLVTASTLAGYGGALAFGHDGSTGSYGYKTFGALANTQYTFCAVVKMDDSGAPTFGSSFTSSPLNPFALVCQDDGLDPLSYTQVQLTDGCWLVCRSYSRPVAGKNFGVVKYASNNSCTFKVTRYGLFQGTVTAQQILAAGGIPLTTTAAASSAKGNYWWQFDPTAPGDSLQTSITTGNEGWVCAGVNFTDSNSTIVCSGAGSNLQKGIWAYRTASNDAVNMLVGNGTLMSNAVARPMPANTPCVWEGWWTATTVGQAVDGVGAADVARSGDASPPPAPLRIGAYTDGVTYAANGGISVTIIMPTVLPTATERATLRQFIASLSGFAL